MATSFGPHSSGEQLSNQADGSRPTRCTYTNESSEPCDWPSGFALMLSAT